jgi:hypothetical protein
MYVYHRNTLENWFSHLVPGSTAVLPRVFPRVPAGVGILGEDVFPNGGRFRCGRFPGFLSFSLFALRRALLWSSGDLRGLMRCGASLLFVSPDLVRVAPLISVGGHVGL